MTWMLVILALAAGCAGVKPYQREKLAKPKMQLARDPQASEMTEHVYESREGAAGGAASGGGGCGCN